MDSDIGDVGEKEFEFWCSRERIIATRPEKDRNGWDYNVEFSHDLYTDSVLSLHQAPVECRVQVKSIIKIHKKKQINLKNLTLLAKSTLPAFILFLEYNDEQILLRAYLIHIDFEWIKKILQKTAPIAVGETHKELHHTMMTIKYDDSHQFSDLSGRGFANEVLNYIGNNMDAYVQQKKAYLQQVGFEKGSGKFSFKEEVGESKLLDLSLGLIDEIDIEDFEVSFKRFGVDYLKEQLEIDRDKITNRTMTIDLNPQDIIFKYREDSLSPWRCIEGLFYNTCFNRFMPENDRKFRIALKYVDFVVYYLCGKVDVDLSIEEDELLELNSFCELCRLFVFLNRTSTPIECCIEDKLTKNIMPISIAIDGSASNFECELICLENITKVLNKFQIRNQVCLSRKMLYEQRKGIFKLIHLPNFDATTCSAEITMEKTITDIDGLWLHGYLAPLADLTLGYIIVIKGLIANVEHLDYEFTGEEVIEVRQIVIDDSLEDVSSKLGELITSMKSKYSDNYSFMLSNISVEGEEDNLTLQNQS